MILTLFELNLQYLKARKYYIIYSRDDISIILNSTKLF